MILIIFLIICLLSFILKLDNIKEKFIDKNNIFLLKNLGNNKCIYSNNSYDIFNKNQNLLIGKCSLKDKRYYWDLNNNKIQNLISEKCLCNRQNYTNQYYCNAPIDNLKWNISKFKEGYRISNNGLCLSSECGWDKGSESCFLQKCDKKNKNQYWNFINPYQKNYVSLIDNKNKCLTLNEQDTRPYLSECKENDINQEWIFENNNIKNRSTSKCIGNNSLMTNCNNNDTWKWSINSLKNTESKCLASNNTNLNITKCDYNNKNQNWIEKAPYLNENIKTSELTTAFSDLYYNLNEENNNNYRNNLFWDTRRYQPIEKKNTKDKIIDIIN